MKKSFIVLMIAAVLFLYSYANIALAADSCCLKQQCGCLKGACCVKGECKCEGKTCCAKRQCNCAKTEGCKNCKCS